LALNPVCCLTDYYLELYLVESEIKLLQPIRTVMPDFIANQTFQSSAFLNHRKDYFAESHVNFN